MMYQARKAITTPAPTKRTDVEMATFVILELWGEISFAEGEGLSGCEVTFGVTTVGTGL